VFARIALSIPVDRTFDFLVPKEMQATIEVGGRVAVHVGGRPATGIVVALAERSEHPGQFESIEGVLDGPTFSTYALEFASRAAERYVTPLGLLLHRALPRRCGRPAPRWLTLAVDLQAALAALDSLASRAPRQAQALRHILASGDGLPESALREQLGPGSRATVTRLLDRGLLRITEERIPPVDGPIALPFAQTSAEKAPMHTATLLCQRSRIAYYAEVIGRQVAADGLVLVLTPSILHAEGIFRSLRAIAPGRSSLYHSTLSEGQRGDVWAGVRCGRVRLIVGTRSALFVPARSPTHIIIDDEGAPGHRQEDMAPRYHARDLAALHTGAELTLGASAPSIEAWHAAAEGSIPRQGTCNGGGRVRAHVVDVRHRSQDPLDERVTAAIRKALDDGGRVLIGVPRRGYFQAIVCKSCGQPLRCPHCSANLTYRAQSAQFVCLRCGRASSATRCAGCGSRALRFVGHGSEQVAGAVRATFPEVPTYLLDASALRRRKALADAERELRSAEVIVATPVIATGPPLEGVRLVVALDVDALLARPDFRAAETAYQYLDGLRNRAEEGALIVQACCPDHPVIRAVAAGEPDAFYTQELAERRALGYPPFSTLVRVVFASRQRSRRGERRAVDILEKHAVETLGPVEQRDGAVLLAKIPDTIQAQQIARELADAIDGAEIDIDGPIS